MARTTSEDAKKQSDLRYVFLRILVSYFFRERGREGEREGEKHQCLVASHMPSLGTWTETQACALTGNQTSDPLVCSPCSIH